MSFMQFQLIQKGALYSADCDKCGTTLHTHEWVHEDHNDRRDAMEAGTLRCDDCLGKADASTFTYCGRQYAARYSAPGYLDCSPWEYGKNKRALKREARDMYGEC